MEGLGLTTCLVSRWQDVYLKVGMNEKQRKAALTALQTSISNNKIEFQDLTAIILNSFQEYAVDKNVAEAIFEALKKRVESNTNFVKEVQKNLYREALERGDKHTANVIHTILEYPVAFKSNHHSICRLMSEYDSSRFMRALLEGPVLSGAECRFARDNEKNISDDDWKKLAQLQKILAVHPAITRNSGALTSLQEDMQLVRMKIKGRVKAEVFEAPINEAPRMDSCHSLVVEDSQGESTSSTSLDKQRFDETVKLFGIKPPSTQDYVLATGAELDTYPNAPDIEITPELLRMCIADPKKLALFVKSSNEFQVLAH